MNFRPGIGKTPDDWAEEEARRRERHERAHNPHGRSPSRTTRLVIGWAFALLAVALVVATILGLAGVIDVFGASG